MSKVNSRIYLFTMVNDLMKFSPLQLIGNLLDVSSLFDVFRPPRLRAEQFVPGNQEHVAILKSMGITMIQTKDGRIQLMQTASAVRFME